MSDWLIADSLKCNDSFRWKLECESLKTPRQCYLSKYYYHKPNFFKLYQLLNSNKISVIKKVSKFISLIFQLLGKNKT